DGILDRAAIIAAPSSHLLESARRIQPARALVGVPHLQEHRGNVPAFRFLERRIEQRAPDPTAPPVRRDGDVRDLAFVGHEPRHNITHDSYPVTPSAREVDRVVLQRLAKRLRRPRIAERGALDRHDRRNVVVPRGANRDRHSVGSGRPCVDSHFTCASANRPYAGSQVATSTGPVASSHAPNRATARALGCATIASGKSGSELGLTTRASNSWAIPETSSAATSRARSSSMTSLAALT